MVDEATRASHLGSIGRGYTLGSRSIGIKPSIMQGI